MDESKGQGNGPAADAGAGNPVTKKMKGSFFLLPDSASKEIRIREPVFRVCSRKRVRCFKKPAGQMFTVN